MVAALVGLVLVSGAAGLGETGPHPGLVLDEHGTAELAERIGRG